MNEEPGVSNSEIRSATSCGTLRAALALSLDGTGGAAAIGDPLCDFAEVPGLPANS